MTRPVAGYFRVSKARDDGIAPDVYQREIEGYCKYRELELVEVFSDVDFSGFRGSRPRPAMEELTTRRNEFSAVVVPKLSRFGRSMKDLVKLFELFDDDGISLIFLDMNLDTSTSQGRLLRYVLAAFAEYESDVKADYARSNQAHRTLHGLPAGGPAPYGYINKDKSYAIDPEKAAIVRDVYRRALTGEPHNAIARWLNNSGVPSPGGSLWQASMIGVLIFRPANASLMERNGKLVPGSWEPIVPRELWDRVIRHHKKRPGILKNSLKKREHHLLYGLLVCGVCGRSLHHHPHTRNSPIYSCPTSRRSALGIHKCPGGSISARRAETLVTDALKDRFWFAFTGDPEERSGRLTSFQRTWDSGDVTAQRELLAFHIERIVLLPRADSEGQNRRQLEIEWIDPDAREVTRRKTCSRCGQRKDLDRFYRTRSRKDGLHDWCKNCEMEQERVRKARQRQRESILTGPPDPTLPWHEYSRQLIRAKADPSTREKR